MRVENKIADNLYYNKAFDFLDNGERDSAFLYFSKAKEAFISLNDSLGAGKSLVNMAIIEADNGDYFGSQETSMLATTYLQPDNETNYPALSSNYNSLGITENNLRNYKAALKYYKLALGFSKDSSTIKIYKNNIANSYKFLKKYDSAISIYEKLKFDTTESSRLRVLDNLAYTKFLQNQSYDAEPELLKVLKIRENKKDLWGQNASHAHLSDYFTLKNEKKALFHAQKMRTISYQIKSADDQLEALQKLISLETRPQSRYYFKVFQKLNDSVQTARNKAKNQFALIRYETEKNKSDFLNSQAENERKENQILKQYFALALLATGLCSAFFWYRKRKKYLEQEKQIRVKETELKMSKKVHDVVANGIYQVMTKIENLDEFDKEQTLDELELVYEKSRDISYEPAETGLSFSKKITQTAKPYTTPQNEITLIGNDEDLWNKIPENLKTDLLIIFRELLVNMKKHSRATNTSVKFQLYEGEFKMTYMDNGVGLGAEFTEKNGLKNTGNRIAVFGGRINFEHPEKGLKINIQIPVKQ